MQETMKVDNFITQVEFSFSPPNFHYLLFVTENLSMIVDKFLCYTIVGFKKYCIFIQKITFWYSLSSHVNRC